MRETIKEDAIKNHITFKSLENYRVIKTLGNPLKFHKKNPLVSSEFVRCCQPGRSIRQLIIELFYLIKI